MTQVLGTQPRSRSGANGGALESHTARRWAWALGFSLPLSGGLSPSAWIAGYPDQVTVVRLVTLAALLWLLGNPGGRKLPAPSRRMLQAFLAITGYAVVSLAWTPDPADGIDSLVGVAMALSTGVAVLLLVRDDRRTLASFAAGLLVAFVLQVVIAAVEIRTGLHLTSQFGASDIDRWGLTNVEVLFGSVAWGTLGNPNDLGGFLLLSIAVFASARSYGLALSRRLELTMWVAVIGALAVGLTSLADARAYRLGIALVVVLHLLDRVLPRGGTLRVSMMMMISASGIAAYALLGGGSQVASILNAGDSDALRLTLASRGLSDALQTGGLGLGIGAEEALFKSGQIATNFHSVAVQLAAELGLIVAGLFLVYLVGLVISWALVTRSARLIGSNASLARATLATSLLIYGSTSSGVLESPHFWAFFVLTALLASTRQSEAANHSHFTDPAKSTGQTVSRAKSWHP